MDSFIVRVYQRDSRGEQPIFGTVQPDGQAEEVEFHSAEELNAILTAFRDPETWTGPDGEQAVGIRNGDIVAKASHA